VVIVEGNMDVISSHQAGVKTAVATSGTAMTEQHLKILARMTDDIRLAYDGDEAGIKATERAINLAGGLGLSLSVISNYHGAKDPDELIQKGAELWQEAVSECRPAVDWLLDKYEEKLDLDSGPGKKEYSDIAMKLVGYLKDPVERKHYEQKIAKRLDVAVEDLVAKKAEFTSKPKRLKKVKNTENNEKVLKGLEDNLLAIMIYGGESGAKIGLDMPEDETRLEELSMIYDTRYGEWKKEALDAEVVELLKRYEKESKKQKIEELSDELEKVSDDEEKSKEILREIIKLNKT